MLIFHRPQPYPLPSFDRMSSFSFSSTWNFRSVIGKLNCLKKKLDTIQGMLRINAQNSMKIPVAHTLKRLNIQVSIKKNRDKGIILKPDRTKSFDFFADSDFAENLYKYAAENDSSTTKLRTGSIILYTRYPVLWYSKLQTQVALSTTKVDYVSLSHLLLATIPFINLLKLKEI